MNLSIGVMAFPAELGKIPRTYYLDIHITKTTLINHDTNTIHFTICCDMSHIKFNDILKLYYSKDVQGYLVDTLID